jgi:hypothetical protein
MSRHVRKVLVVVALGAGALAVVQSSKVSRLQEANSALEKQVSVASAPKEEEPGMAKIDASELQRLRDEHAELIKLRGEVSALRKEKEAWQKQPAAKPEARKTTAQAPAPVAAPAAGLNEGIDAQGATLGAVRRKLLNNEPLTPEEQALLGTVSAKAAEIEKSPPNFAAFQSFYIASLLGWPKDDPRGDQLQQILFRAATAANEKGFNYNAPAQNSTGWDDAQKNLDGRATAVIKNLLTPEEKALFEKTMTGVLGIDLGAR